MIQDDLLRLKDLYNIRVKSRKDFIFHPGDAFSDTSIFTGRPEFIMCTLAGYFHLEVCTFLDMTSRLVKSSASSSIALSNGG
jgi:hypothetical protein